MSSSSSLYKTLCNNTIEREAIYQNWGSSSKASLIVFLLFASQLGALSTIM